MAYVKTTWQTGDVITAEKLNNMEGGIEDLQPILLEAEGVLDGSDIVFTFTGYTFADVIAYVQAGRTVRVKCRYASSNILWVFRFDTYIENDLGGNLQIPSVLDTLTFPASYEPTDTFQLISAGSD